MTATRDVQSSTSVPRLHLAFELSCGPYVIPAAFCFRIGG
jgi:hypothetical protein